MVAQAVRAWNPDLQSTGNTVQPQVRLDGLEGAWHSLETDSHIYAKIVNGELIAPYCYGGNDSLIGVYFGWKKAGEYWFARYAWLDGDISGFAFLKQQSVDVLTGAWWYDEDQPLNPDSPPEKYGVIATWQRMPTAELPAWALQFITEVERNGLPSRLIRR
jgi:hypothetical protein